MAAQVPNIFVEQYDQGQKKIRADLMDENFAYVCTQLDNNAAVTDGKANADLDDVTAAGKAVMANAAMPSSQSISLSVPASGGTVTVPATGYLQLTGDIIAGQTYCALALIGKVAIRSEFSSGNVQHIFIPVTASDVVTVYYTNMENLTLKFVYANGTEPNA